MDTLKNNNIEPLLVLIEQFYISEIQTTHTAIKINRKTLMTQCGNVAIPSLIISTVGLFSAMMLSFGTISGKILGISCIFFMIFGFLNLFLLGILERDTWDSKNFFVRFFFKNYQALKNSRRKLYVDSLNKLSSQDVIPLASSIEKLLDNLKNKEDYQYFHISFNDQYQNFKNFLITKNYEKAYDTLEEILLLVQKLEKKEKLEEEKKIFEKQISMFKHQNESLDNNILEINSIQYKNML